jgi:hypothetical protein
VTDSFSVSKSCSTNSHTPYPTLHTSSKGRDCYPDLTGDLVDGLGKTLDVGRSDTSDRNSAILGSVDTVLLGQGVHLFGLETSVGEHANLAGDVAPVVLATELLEVLLEKGTHGDDTVSHTLDLAQPLLVEFGVVQDGGSNTGTVDRRVGVKRTDQDLDLRVHALLLLDIGADDGEGTNTLTVETLGKVSMRISFYILQRRLTMFLAKLWQSEML